MLGEFDKVNVVQGSISPTSKCQVKTCESKAVFMIFNEDGATKMSRWFYNCCGKHLPLGVRKAWKDNETCKKRYDLAMNKSGVSMDKKEK